MKKILILSYGPVPTPEQKTVEGGGLRVWGLANGLRKNSKDFAITVGFNDGFKKDSNTEEVNGIKVKMWNDASLPELIDDADSVIVSYNAGDMTIKVLENIRDDQQLILDGYVPIHIEMSARNSANLQKEFDAFNFENKIWTRALLRGDVLMCANENQLKFYRGVMASVGRVNPITYTDENLIQIVPYGIYREKPVAKDKPVQKMLTNKRSFKLLWFGGIYPWFDLTNLLKAVKIANKKVPIELVMVGVKNPFNQHPDFIAKYNEVIEFIADEKLGDIVHLSDWVPFDTRADWYLDSDAVILINKIGVENTLAWRTRLVDYIWADLPVITNGGDPLSDILESENAVEILKKMDVAGLANTLENLAKDPNQLKKFTKNMEKVRERLYWDKSTEKISKLINEGYKPEDLSARVQPVISAPGAGNISKIKSKLSNGIIRGKRYADNYGVKAATKIIVQKVFRTIKRLSKRAVGKIVTNNYAAPRIVVISHQLDYSGAPYVLMDLVSDMVKKYPDISRKMRFITSTPFENSNVLKLKHIGINTEIYTGLNFAIDYNPGDIVILNTFAMTPQVMHSTFNALEKGTVKEVYWYGHEATPEGFIDNKTKLLVRDNLDKGKIKLFSVSEATKKEYQKFFGIDKNIYKMEFRFNFPLGKFRTLSPVDFTDKLNFILPGSVLDARKGQLPILYAFLDFYDNYYKKNPEKYRDFSLKFVGVDGDNFVIKQLKLSAKGLGERVKIIGKVPREKSLEYISDSNITICYSIHEAMGIFVYEGMAFGHPIIRNEAAGQEEQLIEGKNGFGVESDDFNGLVCVLEKILNREKVSDEELADMSKVSSDIAKQATKKVFYIIDDIYKIYKK